MLAEHAVNIEGQLLGTRGEYGYLLTDIGIDYAEEVLKPAAGDEPDVRLRVLS
jgi:D-3-phosphoglycerate dehydrogenase